MSDISHLNAIEYRLSNERIRRDLSTGRERTWRDHNVRMIERERDSEISFLANRGIVIEEEKEISLEEIFAELEI